MNNTNLVLVDTRMFEYHLLAVMEKDKIALTVQNIEQATTVNLLYLLSGAWLHNLDTSSFQIIFCMDSKPYWRHQELYRLGIDYKGNRNRNPKFETNLSIVHTQLEYILSKNNLSVLQYSELDFFSNEIGWEADDIAATITRAESANYKHIYLLTDDTDWLPLTSLSNVYWLSLKGWAPRVRNAELAIQWWKDHKSSNSSHARRQFPKDDILQLWHYKALFGDKSDNLRGDLADQSRGKYLPFVHLWEPHMSYRLHERINFTLTYKNYLTQIREPISIEVWQGKTKGLHVSIASF